MRLALISSAACLALSACGPTLPDSGVGFDNYDSDRRATVDAQLEGRTDPGTGQIQPPPDVQSSTLDGSSGSSAGGGTDDIAAMAAAALDGGAAAPTSNVGPAPAPVSNAAGISSENDFDAVSNERSIQQDAALVAQNRAQYQVVEPTALPSRPSDGGPNVVQYALTTTNSVGQPMYSRSAFASKDKELRNCAGYASDDLAQEAFLSNGGPERDRRGLDADGDGFACDWNPAPFRRARGG